MGNKRKASFTCILTKSHKPSTNPVPPRELWRVLFKQTITYLDLFLNKYPAYTFQIQDIWSAQDEILRFWPLSSCWCYLPQIAGLGIQKSAECVLHKVQRWQITPRLLLQSHGAKWMPLAAGKVKSPGWSPCRFRRYILKVFVAYWRVK